MSPTSSLSVCVCVGVCVPVFMHLHSAYMEYESLVPLFDWLVLISCDSMCRGQPLADRACAAFINVPSWICLRVQHCVFEHVCDSVLTECLSSLKGIPPKVFFFLLCLFSVWLILFTCQKCVCVCIKEVGGGETGGTRVFVDRETNTHVKSPNKIETVWSLYPEQLHGLCWRTKPITYYCV